MLHNLSQMPAALLRERGDEAETMTFFTLDEDDIPPDGQDVLAVSSLLQITEFRLFELAYQRWFGTESTPDNIEPYFVAYMFKTVAPPWVRQFCREVLGREKAGTLNPADFGVFPREESLSMLQRGVNYALVITVVVVTLHLAAILVVNY